MIKYTSSNTSREIPKGFCLCGCGQKTAIAERTDKRKGWVKGEPKRFIAGHSRVEARTIEEAFRNYVSASDPDACWEWNGYIDPTGYGRMFYNRVRFSTHRLSYQIAFGEIPDGLQVCHKCDNRKCVNPNHLFLGTVADNMQDASNKRRLKHGENHHLSKITKAIADEIRSLYPSLDQRQLAKKFSVSKTTVANILHNRIWTY